MSKYMALSNPPFRSLEISLSDQSVAKIGMVAILEARSKSLAEAALKGAAGLSAHDWKSSEKHQFRQTCARLIEAAKHLSNKRWIQLFDNIWSPSSDKQQAILDY